MKTNKVLLSVALAAAAGILAADGTSAQVRRERVRAEEDAAMVRTPETTTADEAAHQSNQQSREQSWNQASPNEKATTYNVAKTRHTTKQTDKANESADHSANVSSRHSR